MARTSRRVLDRCRDLDDEQEGHWRDWRPHRRADETNVIAEEVWFWDSLWLGLTHLCSAPK